MKWLYKHWYKSTLLLASYLLLILLLFVYKSNFSLFLIWLQFIVYLLHQAEEYILPGGFVAFFNKKVLGATSDNYPLDEKASFWINIPIIFVAYPLSAVLAGFIDLSLGIWTAYFSIINATSHVIMFFKHKYNPGLIVSSLLNIPIGLFTIYHFQSEHLITPKAQLIGALIGLFVQGTVMFYGFKVLKPKIK